MPDLFKEEDDNCQLSNIMTGRTKSDPQIHVRFIDTNPLLYVPNEKSWEFDVLKRALENFSKYHNIGFSKELRQRLVKYGKTAFEPARVREYTLENA